MPDSTNNQLSLLQNLKKWCLGSERQLREFMPKGVWVEFAKDFWRSPAV
jgi:hypothetical protein